MAVVTLTFSGSEEEIVSGIPKFMTIESNIPATIYFTLDGSTPTTDSMIYIDTFEMPDNENTVILSAFGIDSVDEAGPILTQVFAPDMTRITVSRSIGAEGIVINRADDNTDNVIGYDADGENISYTDLDPDYLRLRLIKSEKGYLGILDGTQIEVSVPSPSDTSSLIDDNFVPFSTPEIGELFNPEAKVIFIDNRLDNDINITLRPYGSLHNIYKEFGGKRLLETGDDAAYISGGFTRRFYDAINGIMVSYYFDHNESRWIKNIQSLPNNIPSINYGGSQSGPPLVIPWVSPGTQTRTTR